MLTKTGLKQIDNVISKRIRQELKPVKSDISEIRKDIKTIVRFFDREYLELRELRNTSV